MTQEEIMERKKTRSYRLAKMTETQIGQLADSLGMSRANVIQTAVDRLFQQEKTMHTIYRIEEEMLGPDATEEEARRMVDLLSERGYNVEYGPAIGQDPDTIPAQVWGECLEQL